jgi:hypothetical protein
MTPQTETEISDNEDWLNAPDGDGWWWNCCAVDGDEMEIVQVTSGVVHANRESSGLRYWNGTKWQHVKPPTPPPKPLPRARQVTLRSDIIRRSYGWQVRVFADDALLKCNTEHSDYTLTREHAIEQARQWSGTEPEVQPWGGNA